MSTVLFPLSQIWCSSLTIFFPRLIDWSFRDVDHLHDNASQVPGRKVSPLPGIDVRGDWPVRYCALSPWTYCVRHVGDDEKSFSLYSGQSSLSSFWNFVLCSKSYDFAPTREINPNTCGSEDQVSRKSISWQIQLMGFTFHFSRSGGMRRCGPVDRVPGCLRLCSRKSYLLVSLSYIYVPSIEPPAIETTFQTLTVRWRKEAMANTNDNCLFPTASSAKELGISFPSVGTSGYFKPEIDQRSVS